MKLFLFTNPKYSKSYHQKKTNVDIGKSKDIFIFTLYIKLFKSQYSLLFLTTWVIIEARGFKLICTPKKQIQKVIWLKPQMGWFKLNCDGASKGR